MRETRDKITRPAPAWSPGRLHPPTAGGED